MNAPERIGRYEVLCELGRGGMAELYLARLAGAGGFAKLVAVKRILPHLAADRVFVEQFLNEGRLAARLSHPNVCQVFELGEADGVLYLVMEYLDGVTWEDLVTMLPEDPRARLRMIAGVLAQACDGLHHAHEQPIVHRDVSPTNLFVTVNGVTKVLDFGVSKLLTEGKHTRTGVLKGKLPYMSPEQIEGTGLDHRSDVWAMGVVVWEAFARRRLFDRTTDFQIWKAITEEAIPQLEDPALQHVVGRALAKQRDDRYPTIAAFADELRALVGRDVASAAEIGAHVRAQCKDQIAERAALVASVVTGSDTIETPAVVEDAGATASLVMRDHSVVLSQPRRRRWPLVAIALVAAAAVTTGVVLATRDRAASPTPAAVARADDVPTDGPRDAPIEVATETPIDAAAAVKSPVVRQHKPTPKVKDAPKEPVVVAPQEPGLFSVESKPFARIFVDGTYIGETPLFRHRLGVGPHTVRAVLEDGREKTFHIKITSAQEVNSGTLRW